MSATITIAEISVRRLAIIIQIQITRDEATHSDIYTDPNQFSILMMSFWSWSTVYGALHILWLKDKSWQTWTDFEKVLKEFELKTSTAYRIDKSDIVKTANNKRQRLLQGLIPEEVQSNTRTVYVCCHFRHCQSKTTGQRKCGRYVSIHHWQDDAIQDFLADRTNGRAYATVLRLSVCPSVCPSVTLCIVAKRCLLEQKLLLRAYRKSYVRNRLVPKWMTLTFV